MNSVKLSKKRPFIIILITLVLLFSLNLNVFAASVETTRVSSSFYLSYFDYDSSTNSDYPLNNVTRTYFSTVEPIYGRPYTKFSFPYLNTVSCGISLDGMPYPLDISYNNLTISFSVYADYSGSSDGSFFVDGSYLILDENGETFGSGYGLSRSELSFNKWSPISITIDTNEYNQFDFITYISIDFFMEYDLNSKSLFYPVIYISDVMFSYDYVPPVSLPSTPIPTPDTSHIDGTLNDLNTVEGELPKVDKEQLADLMDFDFSQFTNSLQFIGQLFDKTMQTFDFNAVLIFSLTVGLAAYVIGRKVK